LIESTKFLIVLLGLNLLDVNNKHDGAENEESQKYGCGDPAVECILLVEVYDVSVVVVLRRKYVLVYR